MNKSVVIVGASGHGKASYYWRLRKVREAYLETAEQTQTFVEVPSPAIHPVNMTSGHKILKFPCDLCKTQKIKSFSSMSGYPVRYKI